MIEANWGAVNPDLIPGARSAVETCLGIRPGEKVVLIADEPSREVAASLAHALALQQAAWTGCLIEDIARRPLSGAPDEVLEALEAADVGILCMKPLPGETSGADGHRVHRGAPADPLCPHGGSHPGD